MGTLKLKECAICLYRDKCEREGYDMIYCLVRYLIWEALSRQKAGHDT